MQRYYLFANKLACADVNSRVANNLKNGMREFHIHKKIRKKYEIDEVLFCLSGNCVIHNLRQVRELAHRMNSGKDPLRKDHVSAADLNAMGLIDEILHYVAKLYLEKEGENLFEKAFDYIADKTSIKKADALLAEFTDHFPPLEVYNKEIKADVYLSEKKNKALVLEELLLLWLANVNPAFEPFKEFFEDSALQRKTVYLEAMHHLQGFFKTLPAFGPEGQDLISLLRSPAVEHPFSLKDQLEYMRSRWGMIIGDFLMRLLGGLDFLTEEHKMRGFGGPADVPVHSYNYMDDIERFSADSEWMPRVILIAKSTLVWLDQLSKKYKQDIKRLDQIPDEELDRLAEAGFTGLWLIGLWERSHASKKIKQWCGNPDAEASAYSLYDYEISAELGGWGAMDDLRQRCWSRGIRMASDMVPNHTGIDSKWMREHPDWFIQSDYPPFPSYNFDTGNLSGDPSIGLHLETHYYSQDDAAVVFKRVDHRSGHTRYIYHGNDGTHMPWNDTAQINFLNAEAREAVIKTIIHVAKNFPIIRFDAAMTLAKKHVQRLWFPEPGHGGDIPSRGEHALSRQDFDAAMPEEFWREVVDRVKEEVPDTLLLAEAFWMMEGYFVRSLGMHRVYNSAFMNMLKNEDNKKYKDSIKNTLLFDPAILQRFVNFMNNPDEDTAIAQFGDGDKYFGVCTLMITMPGLPMFGHGQVEGFTEKYGMEYRKAYHDEEPKGWLVERHYRDIFPLMHKRALFAGAENFRLYDFYLENGSVNDNIFAYTNSYAENRIMVVYNNCYDSSWGWINRSANYKVKDALGGHEESCTIGEALGLSHSEEHFVIFKELRSNLWYIRRSADIHRHGMLISLQGYENQVFVDFYQVMDNSYKHYENLHDHLNGKGVPDIDQAIREIYLAPVYQQLNFFMNALISDGAGVDEIEEAAFELYKEAEAHGAEISRVNNMEAAGLLQFEKSTLLGLLSGNAKKLMDSVFEDDACVPKALALIGFLRPLAAVFQSWFLGERVQPFLENCFLDKNDLYILMNTEDWVQLASAAKTKASLVSDIVKTHLAELEIRQYLQINEYAGNTWFNKEAFERFMIISLLDIVSRPSVSFTTKNDRAAFIKAIVKLANSINKSEYTIEGLLTAVEPKKRSSANGAAKTSASSKANTSKTKTGKAKKSN